MRDHNLCSIKISLAVVTLILSITGTCCAEDRVDPIDYKLSYSYFHTKSLHANDINLRAGKDDQYLWLAAYQESPSDFNQIRAGYERTDRFEYLKLISSLQIASHSFAGGAVNAEIGSPFYVVVGFGRTNLRPYNNLNFDPNDSFTLGAGWHVNPGMNISIYGVQDNRVIDGQRVMHLMMTEAFPDQQKLVVDIFNKSGPPDNQRQSIRGVGASVTYDIHQYFVRFAYDPKVNFTQDNMTRISLGLHF